MLPEEEIKVEGEPTECRDRKPGADGCDLKVHPRSFCWLPIGIKSFVQNQLFWLNPDINTGKYRILGVRLEQILQSGASIESG